MPFDPAQVYPPAEDTFLLRDAALSEVIANDRVLDVGTGSGLIAAEIGRLAAFVLACDINPHAAHTAYRQGIDVVRTDLTDGICGMFDLIIFNPPYLPTRSGERMDDWLEYALDGGESGRDVIERFLKVAGRVLEAEGRILIVLSSLTGMNEVSDLVTRYGYSLTVVGERQVEDETLSVIRLVRLPVTGT